MENHPETQKETLKIDTTRTDTESVENSDAIYCICKSPYEEDQYMICCDGCELWFHGDCMGISEDQLGEIDLYFCNQCENNKIGKTVWKVKCARKECDVLVSMLEKSKYCSDDCGLEVAKSRLNFLLSGDFKCKNATCDIDKNPSRTISRLKDQLKHLGQVEQDLSMKLNVELESLDEISRQVFVADYVSHLLSTRIDDQKLQTISIPICGYQKSKTILHDHGDLFSAENVWNLKDLLCFNSRNKCPVHGKAKVVPVREIPIFKSATSFPQFDSDYSQPYWAFLSINKLDIVLSALELSLKRTRMEIFQTQDMVANLEKMPNEFEIQLKIKCDENKSRSVSISVVSSSLYRRRQPRERIEFSVGTRISN